MDFGPIWTMGANEGAQKTLTGSTNILPTRTSNSRDFFLRSILGSPNNYVLLPDYVGASAIVWDPWGFLYQFRMHPTYAALTMNMLDMHFLNMLRVYMLIVTSTGVCFSSKTNLLWGPQLKPLSPQDPQRSEVPDKWSECLNS